MAALERAVIRKQNAAGNGYGDVMRSADLKGEVGAEVARQIEASKDKSGTVNVNGRLFMWHLLSTAEATKLEA